MARRRATAMSQAPGLSGMPDSGHCWSAATSASWARSSARPTSRTDRASPAMSRADSIRQTASIARCASEAVTEGRRPPVRRPGGCATRRRRRSTGSAWRSSMAASFDGASTIAQPPMSSLASENGPSVTLNAPFVRLTLAPSADGAKPPVLTRAPDFVASSMKAPISAMSSGVGGGIGTFSSPRVYMKNRICWFSFGCLVRWWPGRWPARRTR